MDRLEVVDIKEVTLDLVEEPTHVLRPVDRDTDKFRALVQSIRERGYDKAEPIEVYYSEVGTYVVARKGMHRFNAAGVAGLKMVWVAILNRAPTDSELISGQVQAEATHTEARPAEFGRAVLRYMDLKENKGKTKVEIAMAMGRRDTGFLDKVLKLATLPEKVRELVDDNAITMANGLSLVAAMRAEVPIDDELVKKARIEGAAAFQSLIAYKVQEVRSQSRGFKEAPARLRKVEDVRTELERSTRDSSAHPQYVRALAWVLRKDPVSAASEGLAPAPTGAEAEGAALRAQGAKLQGALDLADAVQSGLRTQVSGLEKEIERLNIIIETKDGIIKSMEKKS